MSEFDRECDCSCTVFRLFRGRPTLGIVELKEVDWPRDGECACPDPPSDGACESEAIAARYWMTFLVLSVFPAPDSPLCDGLDDARSDGVEEGRT